MDYTTIQSEIVFEGKVFNVRIDTVEHTSGKQMRVDIVEHGGAVVIVPIDKQGGIYFVDQYRHPTGGRILELPAGTLELDESPIDCTIRECQEEIGLLPKRVSRLGGFYLAPGYSTEYLHIFLAEDLQPASLPRDEDEDIRIVRLGQDQVSEHLRMGKFQDAKTLVGPGAQPGDQLGRYRRAHRALGGKSTGRHPGGGTHPQAVGTDL